MWTVKVSSAFALFQSVYEYVRVCVWQVPLPHKNACVFLQTEPLSGLCLGVWAHSCLLNVG